MLLRMLWSMLDEMLKRVETDPAKATKRPGWGGCRNIHEIVKMAATYKVERDRRYVQTFEQPA